MINEEEIKNYLSGNSPKVPEAICSSIKICLDEAVKAKDNVKANRIACLKMIWEIKDGYLKAYDQMKKGDYKESWVGLDRIDCIISYLEGNSEYLSEPLSFYGIDFIKFEIPQFQKVFPYFLFTSRETIIEEEVCNICGKKISLCSSQR